MRVLRDFFDRITRVIDDDFLRSNENAHGRFESLDIEIALRSLELHQIQRRKIARRVIEEEIFRAGISGILPIRAFAGVPFVNRGIELHSRIAADMRSFGDFAQQRASIFAFARLPIEHPTRPPLAAFQSRFHKFVAHPYADIFVLIHHRAVGVAVVTAIIALLDQRPRFFLFLLFGVDELFDIRVPIFERVHLRGSPRFAAALHDVCNLIVNFQERERSARFAATA